MTVEARSAPAATRLNRSTTAELESTVERLLSQGVDLCRLGLGEPDTAVPEHVREAAIAAIRENFSQYTSTAGILPLRAAIADRLRADIGVSYDASEVIVSTGGKQAILNALAALVAEGDEVLIPVPYWVSFPEQVRFIGGVPVPVPTSAAAGYRVTAEDLERHITPRTRVLILNSPNNPSGAVHGSRDLEAIARVCARRGIWTISDEVYSTFVYTAEGHRSIASLPGMRERTVVVNALSKTFGMTGWRVGYSAAPAEVTKVMVTLQSHVTSNVNSIAQRAALAAVSGPQDWLAGVRRDYAARRDVLVDGVARVRGLEAPTPDGAFFLWVDASWWAGRDLRGRRISDAGDLAAALLEEARVAVGPGAGFGSARHLRLSFAAPLTEIREGLARMTALLGEAAPSR
ncbi:MAG: pyridoxal phosphate-dependent aminotransferase [Chloroflexi bacterium]|nr:pyridoxal phosphate-dependent aminotransferase [Chloroflexota bacterium]